MANSISQKTTSASTFPEFSLELASPPQIHPDSNNNNNNNNNNHSNSKFPFNAFQPQHSVLQEDLQENTIEEMSSSMPTTAQHSLADPLPPTSSPTTNINNVQHFHNLSVSSGIVGLGETLTQLTQRSHFQLAGEMEDLPQKNGLILLNMQNDFMEHGALGLVGFDQSFVDKINRLKSSVDWSLVLLSRIRHPNSHKSFSSIVPNTKPFIRSINKQGDDVMLLPDHCVLGTYGSEFCDRFSTHHNDIVVETGLTPEVSDVGLFSRIDSVARKQLGRAKITDVFVAGADVQGDAVLQLIDELSGTHIKVHLISDAMLVKFGQEELFEIVDEAEGTVTLEELYSGTFNPPPQEGQTSRQPEFREDVFEKMLDYARRSNGSAEEFLELVASENANFELTKPHPKSGRYFVHYLCQIISLTAPKILSNLLDSRTVLANVPCIDSNATAVIYCCRVHALDNLTVLLNNREQSALLDLMAYDQYGFTSIMYCINRRDLEMVKLLVAHPQGGRALLRARDSCQRNVLMLACQHSPRTPPSPHLQFHKPQNTQPQPTSSSSAATTTNHPKFPQIPPKITLAQDSPTFERFSTSTGSVEFENSLEKPQHARGEAVLDFLWGMFQAREFSNPLVDASDWTFWNYAVKHNLIKVLRSGLSMISSANTTNTTTTTKQDKPHDTDNTKSSKARAKLGDEDSSGKLLLPHTADSKTPANSSSTNRFGQKTSVEMGKYRAQMQRRMEMQPILQHQRLGGGLAVSHTQANLKGKNAVVRKVSVTHGLNRVREETNTRAAIRAVLLQQIGFGMNLLHQATWQRSEAVMPLLLSLFSEENLLQQETEYGTTCLDIVVDDIHPKWQFMLIKHGCVPRQTVGLAMYHICIKALLMGEKEVFCNMVLREEYGVGVDSHMLDVASRAQFVHACTSTFTSPTVMLAQLCFICEECERKNTHPNRTVRTLNLARTTTITNNGENNTTTNNNNHNHNSIGSNHSHRGPVSTSSPRLSGTPRASAHSAFTPRNLSGRLFCGLCAFSCHAGHEGVVCVGAESAHCVCASITSCKCKTVSDISLDLPLDLVGNVQLAAQSFKATGADKTRRSSHATPIGTRRLRPGNASPSQPRTARLTRMRSMKRQQTAKPEVELSPTDKSKAELQQLQAEMTYREFVRHVMLMHAAKRAAVSVLESLVKFVKPDLPVDVSLNRPLHLAASTGDINACIIIKHNGGRVSVVNSQGETPLHLAAMHGHVDVCKLIAHNSNMLRLDSLALTPLHHAIRNDHPRVVEVLAQSIRTRAKIALPLDEIFLQVRKTSKNVVDMSACDSSAVPPKVMALSSGECEGHASPLHLAVRYGKVECARILMSFGSSPLKVDGTGYHPYQTGLWELFVTRKRFEAFQDHARQQTNSREGDAKKKRFFRGLQQSHMEAQLEDLNKELPSDLQTLQPSVVHSLVDQMGKAAEVEQERNRFAYRYLGRWVTGYFIVLLLLLAFSLPRANERYYVARSVHSLVDRTGWENIDTAAEAWSWFTTYLVSSSALFPPVVENATTPVGVRVLGAVRLRQVRLDKRLCEVDNDVGGGKLECTRTYTHADQEAKTDMQWQPASYISTMDPVNYQQLSLARTWRHGKGPARVRDFGQYSANGYFVDLDITNRTSHQNRELLVALQAPSQYGSLWFDQLTRYITIEFTLYNLNFDTFAGVTLALEAGATGELHPTHDVTVHTLVENAGEPFPSFGFKLATLLVALFLLLGAWVKAVRRGWAVTMQKRRLWFDIFLALYALGLFSLDVAISTYVSDLNLSLLTTTKFQSIESALVMLECQTFLTSALVLLLWLRLIRYSVLLPEFGKVTYAFMNTMKNFDVLAYLLFVSFVIVGFNCAFRLAFGQVEQTSSYANTLNLMVQMTMGNWDDTIFEELPSVMRSIMFISFMVVVAVIFINLFISVLSEVYPAEKRAAAVQCNDNLTLLLEHDLITNTNPLIHKLLHAPTHSLPGAANNRSQRWKQNICQFFLAHAVVPVLRAVSVIARRFSVEWNFDVPQHEFGWERGREYFGHNMQTEETINDAIEEGTMEAQVPLRKRAGSIVDL